MITRDPETLCRHFGLEHVTDVALVADPKILPDRPQPRHRPQRLIFRFGIACRSACTQASVTFVFSIDKFRSRPSALRCESPVSLTAVWYRCND
jgi:hypothetical protein